MHSLTPDPVPYPFDLVLLLPPGDHEEDDEPEDDDGDDDSHDDGDHLGAAAHAAAALIPVLADRQTHRRSAARPIRRRRLRITGAADCRFTTDTTDI